MMRLIEIRTILGLLGSLMLITGCATGERGSDALSESIKWYTGEMGKVDDNRARQLLERAVETRDPLATMWLARVYSTGRMTFTANKPQAIIIAESVIEEIESLADEGNPEAMFLMGTAFAEGLAKPIDPELAVVWYRRAAKQGNTLAIHNMGNVYAAGSGVEQSDEQAVKCWRQAAEKGDVIPQLRLATMYEEGRGTGQDLDQAIFWYRQAATRGNSAAAAALSRLGGSQ
ncbi:MAG: tetratricopeptide repeat protein [Proteobacteria bacterium]|nr:tetratricopeptide repeat protein [Pseudomonadota bacterium]